MNRKTATILCAAGGLAAAAALVGTRATGTQSPRLPETPPESPRQVTTLCGAPAPARALTDFGPGTMTAALSAGETLRGGEGEIYVSIDLVARELSAAKRPPMSVAIVIDHSGSMQGDKIVRAREAARGLVARLGAEDQAALIQYDDTAEVLVSSVLVNDSGRHRLEAAIDSIQDAGGTNLHDGMALGRDEVMRHLRPGAVNRVILLSDGNANVGVTDVPTLARVASDASERGVRITTVGLGLDYNEDLMQQVAEHGRGQYYYVRDAATLDAVFAGELKSIQGTVATATEIRLEPSCAGVEIVEVYGYPSHRDGRTMVVPLSDLAGGDKRKIVARLKVPPAELGATQVLTASYAFANAAGGARQTATAALGVQITADAVAIEKSIDREVMGKIAQIESSTTVRQAAEAYQKGDQAAAMRILSLGKDKISKNAGKYASKEELRTVFSDMDGVGAGMASVAPSAPEAQAVTKAAKKQAYDTAR